MEQELACLCSGATQLGGETCVQCVCAGGGGGGGGGWLLLPFPPSCCTQHP